MDLGMRSFTRAAAPLLMGAFVLGACSAPSPARTPGSDTPTRAAQPAGGQQAPDSGQPATGDAGAAPPSADAPAAEPRPAPPAASVPVGLDVGQRAPSFTIAGLDG